MAVSVISKKTLNFLSKLKENNNREWFNENKVVYEEVKEEFEYFVKDLILKVSDFDEGVSHLVPKKCIFRIYRDVRFSKNKLPYKSHISAHISPAISKSKDSPGAGYYIHIEPGASMLAGGAYQPQADWLKNIREEIDYNSTAFKKIVENKEFKKTFGAIEGEKLKRVPKGYDAQHPEVEYLKMKSFVAVHKLTDRQVISPDFFKQAVQVFKVLQPFDAFLNQAIE